MKLGPEKALIFHMTDLANLPSILESGALLCKNELQSQQKRYDSIAFEHIQGRRASYPVRTGGVLHDYVPFSFAPRSPMLYTIWQGNVPGKSQDDIIYWVGEAKTIERAGLCFAFTDGHATMALTDQFSDLQDLGRVDWKVMSTDVWKNTFDDNDRKRRRQAEFLVQRRVPLEFLPWIVVRDEGHRLAVQKTLEQSNHKPVALIRSEWYY